MAGSLIVTTAIAMACITSVAWAGAGPVPGDPDTGFSGDGKVRTKIGSYSRAFAVIRADHGAIYVAGSVKRSDDDFDFLVLRYKRNGALDPDFSRDGIVKVDFKGGFDTAFALAVQDDDKVVAAGRAAPGPKSNDARFALMRLKPNGKLDKNFSGDGKALTNLGDYATIQDIELQGNGRIVAGGSGDFASSWAIARYLRSGRLDTSFGDGDDGTRIYDFPGSSDDQIYGVELDGTSIVVGGYAYLAATGADMAAGRFGPTGVPEEGFSGDGFASVSLTTSTNYDAAYDMELSENGHVVLAGEAETDDGAVGGFGFARFTSAGNLDTVFNSGGSLPGTERESFTSSEDAYEWANGLELQNNGKLVAAGKSSPDETDGDFAVLRLNGDGGLDGTFGPVGLDGVEFTDFQGNQNDNAWDVAIMRDGKIVVVGQRIFDSGTKSEVTIARYQGE